MRYESIKLIGGAEVHVDMDSKRTACRKCKKLIRFGVTRNGKLMPIIQLDNGEWQSHFTDCEEADSFRNNNRERLIEEEERNQEAINNL